MFYLYITTVQYADVKLLIEHPVNINCDTITKFTNIIHHDFQFLLNFHFHLLLNFHLQLFLIF